jgi:hypothetical protein
MITAREDWQGPQVAPAAPDFEDQRRYEIAALALGLDPKVASPLAMT